ncbi:hypothetical protein DNX69_25505 [Rhodopseudomonas palustris]|uniref:DUF1963 domain-containing protein n=1 Tax=Rhodopseudomonas palustris TaxID=1076 RepID=A0A323U9D2_RHOPL|nr:YwqG family protein [Rhodopseudomonas palustris]PZA09051.1 hypothetical protein DNX69_25505 [Rhodopseudomonas palustris]
MSELTQRSDNELLQAWLDHVRSRAAIEHIGALNRHLQDQLQIERELVGRAGGLNRLRELLTGDDPDVVLSAEQALRRSETAEGRAHPAPPDSADAVLPEDRPMFRLALSPPPPAMDVAEIVKRLIAALPLEAAALLRQLRPAIGLWPQAARADAPIDGSRLGGMPCAPPGWQWPIAATEPMLFIGQINCADLRGLPGAEVLPSQGLLSCFGDHDTVMGCLLTGEGGALYYWPETDHLLPAEPPLEMLTVFPRAELLFRPMWDLPDPDSSVIAAILPDRSNQATYKSFHREMRRHGLPAEIDYPCNGSKLLGWPDLLQGESFEFTLDQPYDQYRLLLQFDSYTNGSEAAGLGPGGFLYFFITKHDLADRRFAAAELAIQFT